MKTPAHIRYSHALLVFMGVLLISSIIADGLLVEQQRNQLRKEATRFAERELHLMETFVRQALVAHDADTVRRYLDRWGLEDPDVVRFRVVGTGGEVIVDYRRPRPATQPLRLVRDLAHDGRALLRMELERDVAHIEQSLDAVRLRLVAGSVAFVLVLGGFLWITVQRMALVPMQRAEDELQVHRFRLERRVQERTAELSAANHRLRQEMEEREVAREDLRRHAERLTTLREIDQAVLAARSPPQIAAAALRHLRALVACTHAAVALYDPQAHQAQLIAVDSDGDTRLRPGTRFALDAPQSQHLLEHETECLLTDLPGRRAPLPFLNDLADEGVRAALLVPLRVPEQPVGLLLLASGEPGPCSQRTVDIAHEVADMLAVAIEQGRLHEQVHQYAATLERRVAERTAELREANEELEAFTYSVSHDLRGHLWTVRGFAEFLVEKCAPQLGGEGCDYAQSILEASHAMEALIRDLLAYSQLNRGEVVVRPVDLQPVVEAAVERIRSRLCADGAAIRVDAPLGQALGEEAILTRIVGNLLDNAVKFVAAGTPPQVHIWNEQHRHWAVLWVEDNGIGIPDEDQERIFRVFERLHNPDVYPGTGLGLAIVLRGVARLGGLVGLESQVGRGSRFWVALRKEPDR